jgi:hypothetical protein
MNEEIEKKTFEGTEDYKPDDKAMFDFLGQEMVDGRKKERENKAEENKAEENPSKE